MKNKFKAHAPILSIVLSLLAVGYSFAANVVVIPLAADTPSGAVIAFNSKTCPGGWQNYEGAYGRFVRGMYPGGTVGYEGGSNSHKHQWSNFYHSNKDWYSYNSSGALKLVMNWEDGMNTDGSGNYPIATSSSTTSGVENYYTNNTTHNPPYVQLLYCEKV